MAQFQKQQQQIFLKNKNINQGDKFPGQSINTTHASLKLFIFLWTMDFQ